MHQMYRLLMTCLGLLLATGGASWSVPFGSGPFLPIPHSGHGVDTRPPIDPAGFSPGHNDSSDSVALAPDTLGLAITEERLFGFAEISSEDDLREVSLFSNVVFLSPVSSAFERLAALARARSMRIAIAWDDVLFETTTTPHELRSDYRQRFEDALSSAPGEFRDLVFHQPVDEPYWNGVSDHDMGLALGLMKEYFPGVPSLIVLAWPTLDSRSEPVPSDWVAFDLYYVEDPLEDPIYQSYWNRMLSLNPGKKVVVVADGFYSNAHAQAGIERADMGGVLRSYQALFESEPNAVALGVFRWTDTIGIEGTRSLPADVIREHIAAGSSITNRCGIPTTEDVLAGETIVWFQHCRFYARVEIDDERTELRVAKGSSLTDESGYFWFFGDTNIEIMIKVLDGVAINGHYWVFMSDTTDVNYRLEVHDLWTGNTWSHSNRAGAVSARRDTQAFSP